MATAIAVVQNRTSSIDTALIWVAVKGFLASWTFVALYATNGWNF